MKYPKSLVFSLTNLCNANCVFCYRRDVVLTPRFFPVGRFMELVDEVGLDLKILGLSGIGEPMLHPEFKEFVNRARRRRSANELFLEVTTNGSRLAPEMNQFLIDREVSQVWISLNAATAQTHCKIMPGIDFSEVIAGIRDLIRRRNDVGKNKPELRLSFVLNRHNYTEAESFVHLALDVGADFVTIGGVDRCLSSIIYENQHVPFESFGSTYDRIERLCQRDKRVTIAPRWALWPKMFEPPGKGTAGAIHCPNTEEELGVFFTSGETTFCCYMAAKIEESNHCVGNALHESVAQMWNSKNAMTIRRSLKDLRVTPAICKECDNFWGKQWLPPRRLSERIRLRLRKYMGIVTLRRPGLFKRKQDVVCSQVQRAIVSDRRDAPQET